MPFLLLVDIVMDYEFQTQFKIASDIRLILNKIKEAHVKAKLDTHFLVRSAIEPNTGTIYKDGHAGPHPWCLK